MAEFLTTQGTSYYIEDIIRNARNELVLISPFLQISKTLLERLKDADRQNVKIILIYGKDEMKPDEKKKLKELKNLSLYFFENLHAKCFFNETSMVITSMNMYEFSEKTNREMGVLIRAKGDEKVYSEAVKETRSIIDSATKDSLTRNDFGRVAKEAKPILYSATKDDSRTPSRTRTTSRTKQNGFCIRCGTPIPYNLDVPYCHDCWKKWDAKGGNPDYRERDGKCHACGKPAPTTMAKPLCDSCYRSQK